MADVFLEPLIQEGLAVTMQRDDAYVEARTEIGDNALEIFEGHDPSPIDEVMLLIALRAVDAPEIARINGFDREEDRLAPHPVALQEIAEAGGDSIQVPQVLHGI